MERHPLIKQTSYLHMSQQRSTNRKDICIQEEAVLDQNGVLNDSGFVTSQHPLDFEHL